MINFYEDGLSFDGEISKEELTDLLIKLRALQISLPIWIAQTNQMLDLMGIVEHILPMLDGAACPDCGGELFEAGSPMLGTSYLQCSNCEHEFDCETHNH
jgi:hypothetical protein